MSQRKFRLWANVSSDNLSAIKPALERIIADKGTIRQTDQGFEVEAGLEGESARVLNRMILSELRKAEKRTRLADMCLDRCWASSCSGSEFHGLAAYGKETSYQILMNGIAGIVGHSVGGVWFLLLVERLSKLCPTVVGDAQAIQNRMT